MKYVLIIVPGLADEPNEALGHETPLAAAETPQLDALAAVGRIGMVTLCPRGRLPSSETTLVSALGYDPELHRPAFAPIETLGMECDPPPADAFVFRLNAITAADGVIIDYATAGLAAAEHQQLLDDVLDAARTAMPEVAAAWSIIPGRGHRSILIDTSQRDDDEAILTPAPLLPGEALSRVRPSGPQARLFRTFIEISEAVLAEHPINLTREELGRLPVTHFWPWGGGRAMHDDDLDAVWPSFASAYDGVRGCMLCAEDFPAGLARRIAWPVIRIDEGDPPALIETARRALTDHDLLCLVLNAADEAAHDGDAVAKVRAIEAMDASVIGPVASHLRSTDDWRLLVLPAHATSSLSGRHLANPVPFLLAGRNVSALLRAPLSERDAAESDLHVEPGWELMEYVLFGSGIGRHVRTTP